ncbi:1-hydroxycarotenoid 3,4-desaturase CrtD [Aurantiacibacter zhengii]|uniref:Phytoene desaturase n=1 Tax=Aurantiacibacter zhengii TaxID=2307003 RepID=A0A418NSQ2_9SPHN|nr:1-hydroxycarotenoid 3,4-desaturase CrtD [Aurantiacibacter zhengii]RIV85972.1 phytoene desaturase [Aurantiacibacter zhengii]
MAGRTVIIGAGMGGLACAARLACAGHDVTLLEKEAWAGGKARQVAVDGAAIDAGPTVFTMRDVFDDIFRAGGSELDDYVSVRPAQVLARHAWDDDSHLDLHADPRQSEEAIGAFAGADAARGYRAFRTEAARIHGILENSMLRAGKVSWPLPLMWRIGLWRVGDLLAIRPYESMWKVLGEHFADQRLRQLFARYSTYCGSSPFATPATLMLVAHVEAQGVWLIDGGMSAMADALRRLAQENGATIRFGAKVRDIEVSRGRAQAVVLDNGERIAAQAIVANCDPAALADGRFGQSASRAVASLKPRNRSLSAMVWLAHARTTGFPLSRHNVLFSPDYPREFADISAGRPPGDPSVYVCAQDRDAEDGTPPGARERLQIIVNAPANGDTHTYTRQEMDQCTEVMRHSCARAGLILEDPLPHALASPNTFEGLFPSTGGALYGRASHGWAASFLRQGTKTRIAGLYCAGGSTHPGAGVPMAALSGGLAAAQVTRDLASMRRLHPVAMPGGMSMRSAKTEGTA